MIIKLNSQYKSLYIQIYQGIKEKIIDGDLEKNTKLPSIRQFMKDYKISKNTVIDAYYQLELEGYIRSIEKKGFYVNEIENLLVSGRKKIDYVNVPVKEYKYDFSIGGVDSKNFPFSIWKKIYAEQIDKKDENLLTSMDSRGDYKLRFEIGKYLNASRGLNTEPDDIIISSGTENLFGFVNKLFDDRELYGFENPGYAWGNPFFFNNIKFPIPINMDSEGIILDELIKKNAKFCITTPAHNFPTGIVTSINRRIQLLNISEENDLYIIEIDYDGEFKYKGRPIPALKSMDLNDRVIYMSTFSKSLSPGLRVSYMVLPKKLMLKYNKIFEGYVCSCSTLNQKTLAEFMGRGHFEKHINKMRTVYAKKYQLCEKLLSEISGVKVSTPESGNSFILKIPKLKNMDEFIASCEKSSIKITPVNKYRFKPSNENDLIFDFAKTPLEDLEDGIKQLSELIK